LGARREEAMEYSTEFKEAMVKKMLGPPPRSASSLSPEVGVSKSALASWRNMALTNGGMPSRRKNRKGKQRSAKEKLRIVNHAMTLKDEELGEFLRKEGIYEAQLEEWREEMLQGLSGEESDKELRAQLKFKSKKIKELERELRRKEKALAEAAALLVLKKKAEAYFGVDEDEDILKKKS